MNIKSILWAAALLLPMGAAKAETAMEFHNSHHCRAQVCSPIVLASGTITQGTYDRLTSHIREMDAEPAFIAFNSTGGNLGQALKMGVLIRALGLSTRVASGSDCFSACVYAFIGGVSRVVDEGARMGVHQFTPESEDIQVTTEDTRLVIEGVSRYTEAMNVSEHLASLALMATPDQINLLTHSQVKMLGLDNRGADLATVRFLPSTGELRIGGASLGTDRKALFAIRPVASQPGMLAIVSTLSEPGLYPRLLMEERMKKPGKLMVCPAPGMEISSAAQCLFVPAIVHFSRQGDGVYIAGFTVAAQELAGVMSGSSHITIAAGPDGHPPLVSLALDARGLPEKILRMGSH